MKYTNNAAQGKKSTLFLAGCCAGPTITVALLSTLPFLPSLFFGFVYDDYGTISENGFLFNPANFIRTLLLQSYAESAVVDHGRPVLLLSYFLDRWVWGSFAPGYRLTNLVIHMGSGLMLYQLINRFRSHLENNWIAAIAALLFAVHPLTSETVQMPAYREDLLVLFFTLAAMLVFIHKPVLSGRAAGLVTALFALAIGTKESAVMAPGWLALSLFIQPVDHERKRRFLLLGFLTAAAAAYAAYTVLVQNSQAGTTWWNGRSLAFPENVWTAPWLYVRYLHLMAWPLYQSIDHFTAPVRTAADHRFWIGVTALLLTLNIVRKHCRSNQPEGVAAGWILLTFIPVANLVPLLNPFAERYAYHMAAGIPFLCAAYFIRIKRRQQMRVATVILAGLVALAGGKTAVRLQYFRSDETLWKKTLETSPESTRALVWEGLRIKREGSRKQAYQLYEKALTLNPLDVPALINKAVLLGESGLLHEAHDILLEALSIQPEKSEIHANLATVYALRNDWALHLEAMRKAADYAPWSIRPNKRYLQALNQQGNTGEYARILQRLETIQPGQQW